MKPLNEALKNLSECFSYKNMKSPSAVNAWKKLQGYVKAKSGSVLIWASFGQLGCVGLIEQGQFTKWYDEQVEKNRPDDVGNTLRIDVCLVQE